MGDEKVGHVPGMGKRKGRQGKRGDRGDLREEGKEQRGVWG